MRIAIQGEVGSFHENAARQWFDSASLVVPCDDFRSVFQAVKDGHADALVVAIENSLYGSINEVYDLVEASGYPIIGEVKLRIAQQLIALPEATSAGITRIYSHPVALAQCQAYLDEHFPDAERIEHPDTAESVAFIKELGDPAFAAIASREAAKYHGLPILDTNIEDHAENFTRFLVLQPEAAVPEGANRSSLVLVTSHQPGALAGVLTRLADDGINLVKLQSRPIVGRPWHYKFYLVLETAGQPLHAAIDDITANGNQVTVLGEYVADES